MILINNPSISPDIFLCRPGAAPQDPNYRCRVFAFPSLLKAKEFAQEDGIVIPDHNLVIRFVGVSDRQKCPININALEEIVGFMDEAAEWLARNWPFAIFPVELINLVR